MYKLAVADVVKVPVKFNLNTGNKISAFAFSLACTRLDQKSLKQIVDDDNETISEVVKRIATGWQGQTLVLDADDKPAEFSADALDAMLSVPGVAPVAWTAYLKEVGAKEKN